MSVAFQLVCRGLVLTPCAHFTGLSPGTTCLHGTLRSPIRPAYEAGLQLRY